MSLTLKPLLKKETILDMMGQMLSRVQKHLALSSPPIIHKEA
jgi:hypothetical protein